MKYAGKSRNTHQYNIYYLHRLCSSFLAALPQSEPDLGMASCFWLSWLQHDKLLHGQKLSPPKIRKEIYRLFFLQILANWTNQNADVEV